MLCAKTLKICHKSPLKSVLLQEKRQNSFGYNFCFTNKTKSPKNIFQISNKSRSFNTNNISQENGVKSSDKPIAINNFRSLAEKYDYFIFDLDGVLWRGHEILKNSFEAIKHLRNLENKKFFFLTNSNRSSRKNLISKMINNNLDVVEIKQVYSSSYILANYVSEKFPELKKFYVIGREGLINELKGFNIEVFGGYEDDFKKLALYDTGNVLINEDIQGVICGFDDEINYFKIFYASQIINRTNVFFGTNYDRYLNINGRRVPGTYSIISAIETSTDKKAEIISKPHPHSLDFIFKDNEIENNEINLKKTLMIGDNLNTDIRFANNSGIDSLLVFTGVTTEYKFNEINYANLFVDFNNKQPIHPDKNQVSASVFAKPTYYMKEIKYF